MGEEKKIQAGFSVMINEDGTLTTTVFPADENVARQATTFDIYGCSKELVDDIESQLLADRVAKAVIAKLMPPTPEEMAKARIAEALAERKSE
jgi:hypothetical protein